MAKLNKTQMKILAALNASPTSMTGKELAAAVGVTAITAKNNGEKMVKLGVASFGESVGNAMTFGAGEFENRDKPKKAHRDGTLECQVCEGFFTDRSDGTTWLHGYKRPGHGYLVGSCFGAHSKPFPATDRLEAYAKHISSYAVGLAQQLARQDIWSELSVRDYSGRGYVKKFKTLTKPTAEETAELAKVWSEHDSWTDKGGEREIWLKLKHAADEWESAHRSKAWSIEGEQKQVEAEAVRVALRIDEGHELHALSGGE